MTKFTGDESVLFDAKIEKPPKQESNVVNTEDIHQPSLVKFKSKDMVNLQKSVRLMLKYLG
jgi:hypothetical protein